MPLFGLVDCNSFYASCEKAFRPELASRPVIVLSNNDGCVVARSPEAKALRIENGTPFFKIKELCRNHRVVAFSSNYTLYGDMSRRVMLSLSHWSPHMEVYSIDEAFLDLSGIAGADTPDYGRELTRSVRQWTGIPVSMGVGPTKTLAKVANRLAKKGGGVKILLDPEERGRLLAEMPVEAVWGISSRWGEKLRRLGISTGLQLMQADPRMIRKAFSIVLERLVWELRGEACLDLDENPEPKKNISVSRSFSYLVTNLKDLEEAVASYTARAAEKLRSQRSVAGGIYVYVRTNEFREGDAQYANAATYGFPQSTSHSGELIHGAMDCLRRVFLPGYLYKKAGVILMDIGSAAASQAQGDLFSLSVPRKRRDALMAALDTLNRTMGRDTIAFAAQGIERPWKLRAEMRSPRYTTRWDELPIAKAS